MNDPIERIVNDFRENNITAQRKYPWFASKYPKLYAMCLSPDFDPTVFAQLLTAKQKMDTNELNAHDASVEFGTTLVNTYIKPKFLQ